MRNKFLATLAVALGFAGLQNTAGAETYTKVIDRVNSPADVKTLTVQEMNELASDIRTAILHKVNITGGHLGPDLGIVEATIALHYVFDSPRDRFVFDVSHQIYPHKILTGRKGAFLDPKAHPEITGYSSPRESAHDNFTLGHTSTSLSLADGLAKARDLKGENYNIVALIGDGSFSGGEALEGLSNAAVLNSNMIIVVNDNVMSIAPVEGGIYNSLKVLRETKGQAKENIFKSMGFEYYYVEEGNDVEKLIAAFKKVKDTNKPTIVHIHTQKGKGYLPAEQDKETYHWMLPGFMNKDESALTAGETYNSITNDVILKKKQKDNTVVAVTPATPGATGMTKYFRTEMGENYTDVGIAEQHAVGYVSGLATGGAKPVLEVMSSFIQRSYDQLSQDFAINEAPATILVFAGGISPMDVTHLGVFDIPLISNIPNIVFLAPTTKEEYIGMLNWSIDQNEHPVVIRVPAGNVVSSGEYDKTDYSRLNKFKVANKGERVAIIGVGNFYQLGKEVQAKLQKDLGINATLINPVYLSGIDTQVLEDLRKQHVLVITLEDGCVAGGYGEKISRYYANSKMKVLNFGAEKEFTDKVPLEELYQKYHLTPELIVKDIVKTLEDE